MSAYSIKFPSKLPDTLWQMHDAHAAAGDQIPNCILPDGVTRQPVEDWDPAQQSLPQFLSRTAATHTHAVCISDSFMTNM